MVIVDNNLNAEGKWLLVPHDNNPFSLDIGQGENGLELLKDKYFECLLLLSPVTVAYPAWQTILVALIL